MGITIDRSNYSRSSMFDCLKPKIGSLSLITKRIICLRSFDVRKNDVQVSSMSDSINLAKVLIGSMFVCSKPKIGCSITNG